MNVLLLTDGQGTIMQGKDSRLTEFYQEGIFVFHSLHVQIGADSRSVRMHHAPCEKKLL